MAPEVATENANATAATAPSSSTVQSAFVSKVSTFPIVHSAIDLAKFYYDETKNRFVLVGQVEKEIVERVVPQVVSATAKVAPQSAQTIVSKGLSQLDQYATTGLEILEKNVPIIKEPTPKIIETGKQLVGNVIHPVDQFVGKALEYSEQKIDTYLPSAEKEEIELQEGPDAKKPRIDHFTRAQNLGLTLSHRLTHKTLQSIDSLRKATPQEIQKILSIDLLRLTHATVEKQSIWLKENVHHLTQHLNKEELNNLIKLLETQATELRNHFTTAIASLEKVTPSSLKETSHAIFVSLSKSLADFADKTKAAASKISLDPATVNDPYLKKTLESLNASISQLQFFANSLTHSTVFTAFQNVIKSAPTAPAAPQPEPAVEAAPEEKLAENEEKAL